MLNLPLGTPQVLLKVHGHHSVHGDLQRVGQELGAPLTQYLKCDRAHLPQAEEAAFKVSGVSVWAELREEPR
ncbi:hypothetical protein [Streptomyces cyaneofuscatus]|uniref:hypothetical protein n=1 Tax=Streptomyces cyaneofuscatus TaxID=66883 RepID=UPI0033A82D57